MKFSGRSNIQKVSTGFQKAISLVLSQLKPAALS